MSIDIKRSNDFLVSLDVTSREADRKFIGQPEICIEVLFRPQSPRVRGDIYIEAGGVEYLHVQFLRNGLIRNFDDPRETFTEDQLKERILEVLDEILSKKLPRTREKVNFLKESIDTGFNRRFFSESPDQKKDRRIAAGSLGVIAAGTGAGIGYLSKGLGEDGKKVSSLKNDLKNIDLEREAYLKQEEKNLNKNIGKELQEVKDKNKINSIKEREEKKIKEKLKELEKARIEKDSAKVNSIKKAIEGHEASLKKVYKNKKIRAAVGASTLGLGAAIGANQYMKSKYKEYSEHMDDEDEGIIPVSVPIGAATVGTGAATGYLYDSGSRRHLKKLNKNLDKTIKGLKKKRENEIYKEKVRLEKAVKEEAKSKKLGEYKDFFEKKRNEIDKSLESFKKNLIDRDSKLGKKLTSQIKENKEKLKPLVKKARIRSAIGAATGLGAAIGVHALLKSKSKKD